MGSDEKRRLVREHVGGCLRCFGVVIRYAAELEEAQLTNTLPEQLESRIRAGLCREGGRVLDRVLEVQT